MKMKTILVIVIVIIASYFVYTFINYDISIKINYGVNVPKITNSIYHYCNSGRDVSCYDVVKYKGKNLKKIKILKWDGNLEYEQNQEKIKWFFDNYKLPIKYFPTYNKESLYYLKTFDNKQDSLLIIYNTKTKVTYIFEYHI